MNGKAGQLGVEPLAPLGPLVALKPVILSRRGDTWGAPRFR
jgi:hypothetical protein